MTGPGMRVLGADYSLDGSEVWTTLRDGTFVRLRSVRAADAPGLRTFLSTVSRDSLDLRFFSAVQSEIVLAQIIQLPQSPAHVSLLMEVFDPTPRIIGQAEYDQLPATPAVAEVAFLVADAYQGRGAGTALLHELARRARRHGIERFAACVLLENQAMRDVFVGAGFPFSLVRDGTEMLVELDIHEEPQTDLALPGLRSRGTSTAT